MSMWLISIFVWCMVFLVMDIGEVLIESRRERAMQMNLLQERKEGDGR